MFIIYFSLHLFKKMPWFDGFRSHKGPSWFELKDVEIVDVRFLAIILVGSLSAVAMIMLVLGTKGKEV